MLSLLLLIPAIACLAVFLVPMRDVDARRFTVGAAALELLASFLLVKKLDPNVHGFQLTEQRSWIADWGISYFLGVDGLSTALIVLTALLTLLVAFGSRSINKSLRAYLGCLFFLEAAMIGVFLALDLVLFYVFWEAMLVPMYLLIGIWGGERRVYAALKFVLFTAAGSLLMLVAIIYLGYGHAREFGQLSFSFPDLARLTLSRREELLLFSAFALAFAIKIPIVPLHTWLPDAHVEAPTGGSVILAGVLLKMGLYGLIRFCIPIFPFAAAVTAPLFAVVGVVGVIYGALVAWQQEDVKKLVAYSSVSHLGFCVLGYGAMNVWGLQGAMLQMINHGLSTAALFFAVGVIYDRWHSRQINDFSGLAAEMPVFARVFLVIVLSSIGLPLTNGFVGEFLILFGGFRFSAVLGTAAVTGVILGAVYMLSMYRRMFFGSFTVLRRGEAEDLNLWEKILFMPLLAGIAVLGIYPQPVLDTLRLPAEEALQLINSGSQMELSSEDRAGAAAAACHETSKGIDKDACVEPS